MAGSTQQSGKPRVVSVKNHEAKRLPRPGADGSPFRVTAVYDPERSGTRAKPSEQTPVLPPAQTPKAEPKWVASLKSLITKQV